jgi:membrane protease subunit HflK
VGDRTVNEVLTVGRQEIEDLAELGMQALCDQYEMGIKVEQVVLQDVNPPDPVKPSFNEVNQAQQEKEKLINEAQAEYNQVIPRARGSALKTVQQAEGYLLDRVNRARGDSARFVALYESYREAPKSPPADLSGDHERSAPAVSKKILLDDQLKGVLPLTSDLRVLTTPDPGRGEEPQASENHRLRPCFCFSPLALRALRVNEYDQVIPHPVRKTGGQSPQHPDSR